MHRAAPIQLPPSLSLAERLAFVHEQMEMAQKASPLAVAAPCLWAVSKTQNPAAIDQALAAGIRYFAENRLQEGVERWAPRRPLAGLQLAFIGALQSNKAADAVAFFDEIHSLDRPKLAVKLAEAMAATGRRPACLIQVNTGEEPQKSGVLPKELPALLARCRELNLPVEGLMAVPPVDMNPVPHFALLRQMAETHGLTRLSMGMSEDYPLAIRQGATDIRVGSLLFGPRA